MSAAGEIGVSEASRIHAFFVSHTWANIRLATKGSIALALTLAVGQSTKVSSVERTTMYVSSIFAVLFSPMRSRVQMIELTLVGGLLIAAVVPYGMLGFLCSHSTLDSTRLASAAQKYAAAAARGDTLGTSPAVFYQPRAAAVSAVFLFFLAWGANVAKTLFRDFTFAIIAGAIVGGILFLEGFLFPTWAQFYVVTKQVLYCAYIGLACSFVTNLFVFPYTAREPYLRLTGDFLDVVGAMLQGHADQFSRIHLRRNESHERKAEEATQSDASESRSASSATSKKQQQTDTSNLEKLQGLRGSLTTLSAGLEAAKVPAKREIAYGHLRGSELESLNKSCRTLIVPILGCNLWSQIVDTIRSDAKAITNDSSSRSPFLESLGIEGEMSSEDHTKFFDLMEERVSPRMRSLASSCSDAIIHIKRALHLGIYSKSPLLVRLFCRSPRAFNDEDLFFSDTFEAEINRFWAGKHISDRFGTPNQDTSHSVTMLILYMESSLYSLGLKLLEFCRWVDELHKSGRMTAKRLVVPKPRRYVNALKRSLENFKHHSGHTGNDLRRSTTGLSAGQDETLEGASYRPDATEAFLSKGNPTLVPRNGPASRAVLIVYRIKTFIFDSAVSAFGFRAAVAMTAAALPAFFPDSVAVFLRYRLIWITFTVLLGLQPVLGQGIAGNVFRLVGTIVGGVAGLVVVEIGRVPAGIIPVFFITVIPLLYLQNADTKKFMLPVLLATITEVLVIGYICMVHKLGGTVVESSGQELLQAPALTGYRILLTLAGVVVTVIFSLTPSLPTARTLLRSNTAKHQFVLADLYMLCAVRGAGERYEVPPKLDKAILQLQTESIAISAASYGYLGPIHFEPSPRGIFPMQDWTKLLTLLDNFGTSLAVLNAAFLKVSASDPDHGLNLNSLILHQSGEQYFTVVTGALFSAGNALSSWQPLPPSLPSVMAAHLDMHNKIREVAHIFQERRQRGIVNDDSLTHLGAYIITHAIMSRFIEDIVAQISVLVGTSGFKTYMATHKKPEAHLD